MHENQIPPIVEAPTEPLYEVNVPRAYGAAALQATESGEPSHDLDLPLPNEVTDMPRMSVESKIVKRNGRNYIVTPVVPLPASAQVEYVIQNLKAGLATDAQKEAVEKYIRPSLERFGVQ